MHACAGYAVFWRGARKTQHRRLLNGLSLEIYSSSWRKNRFGAKARFVIFRTVGRFGLGSKLRQPSRVALKFGLGVLVRSERRESGQLIQVGENEGPASMPAGTERSRRTRDRAAGSPRPSSTRSIWRSNHSRRLRGAVRDEQRETRKNGDAWRCCREGMIFHRRSCGGPLGKTSDTARAFRASRSHVIRDLIRVPRKCFREHSVSCDGLRLSWSPSAACRVAVSFKVWPFSRVGPEGGH